MTLADKTKNHCLFFIRYSWIVLSDQNKVHKKHAQFRKNMQKWNSIIQYAKRDELNGGLWPKFTEWWKKCLTRIKPLSHPYESGSTFHQKAILIWIISTCLSKPFFLSWRIEENDSSLPKYILIEMHAEKKEGSFHNNLIKRQTQLIYIFGFA